MKKEIVFIFPENEVRTTLSIDGDQGDEAVYVEISNNDECLAMPFKDPVQIDDFIEELQKLKTELIALKSK